MLYTNLAALYTDNVKACHAPLAANVVNVVT